MSLHTKQNGIAEKKIVTWSGPMFTFYNECTHTLLV